MVFADGGGADCDGCGEGWEDEEEVDAVKPCKGVLHVARVCTFVRVRYRCWIVLMEDEDNGGDDDCCD
jgi:hypothetical protein